MLGRVIWSITLISKCTNMIEFSEKYQVYKLECAVFQDSCPCFILISKKPYVPSAGLES